LKSVKNKNWPLLQCIPALLCCDVHYWRFKFSFTFIYTTSFFVHFYLLHLCVVLYIDWTMDEFEPVPAEGQSEMSIALTLSLPCWYTCVALWTGPAPEARFEVVARGRHVAGVRQVAFVQVRTRGSVSG
jgi:hypothetical protein